MAAAEDEVPTDRVVVTVDAGVGAVRLNRPDKLNALDPAMFEAIAAAGHRLAEEESVRAVVVSGEGRAFCAGLDLATFGAMAEGAGSSAPGGSILDRLPARITNLFQEVAQVWADLRVPTIAALHGAVLGGGLQIALGCDLRIVAPDARLSVLEIRWGLVPDMTGTYRLPRLVRPDIAKELTWTGRMVSGEEAVALGLATTTAADPLVAALDLARTIAAANPHAIQASKRLLDASGSASAAQQFGAESAAMAAVLGSPNQTEAVMAYFEKRPPAFSDPDT